jgi:ABC-2 type transport system ATP-binding protein
VPSPPSKSPCRSGAKLRTEEVPERAKPVPTFEKVTQPGDACAPATDDQLLVGGVEYPVSSNSTAIDVAVLPQPFESVASPIISVRDVIHRYQDRTALNGVSFDVRPAELFGLLGPNGSGKTTLFRILSTLMVPTSGTAMIAGFDAVRQPGALRRHIGVVFQAQSVDPKLTAYENLWHQGHLYGLRGTALKTRIHEILTRVGLLDRAADLVETFSGGMQRRIELAKGLLHHPKVLLLDEPTTGLDPGARHDLWQYLQILRDEERVSVIVTTHLMEEAQRCDRLAILNEGSLVALGTPEALTREIGGDVVLLEARDPQALADRIRTKFQVDATVMDKHVRLEIESGHHFVPNVVEAFPGEIQSLSVSKPTLEDVFIHRTGHRFWRADAEPVPENSKKNAKKKRAR